MTTNDQSHVGTPPSSCVLLRPLEEADLPAVLAIEESSFPSPWSADLLRQEIHQAQGVGLAAETVGEGLVGYLLCRLYGDMWHVMNLAVAPGQRRRGTGRLLMQRFLGLADATRSVSTLEVRPSNRSAVRLYAGLGFEFVGRRRGYYTDTGEDALVMTRPVGRKEVQAVR